MEEKIKNIDSNMIIIPLLTVVVTFIAGYISNNANLWYLPLIGGTVTVIGELLSRKTLINIGMSTAILFFFFLNYTLAFNITNLSVLLLIFTAIVITWSLARNYLITSKIKKDMMNEGEDSYLEQYQIESTTEILSDILIALLIAFMGSMIALYSYTDIFMVSSMAVPLAVIFSAMVFGVIYILIEVLPRYLKSINTEEE